MTLVRVNHAGLLNHLANQALYGNLTDSCLDNQTGCNSNNNLRYRISDEDEAVTMEFAIPGLTKEDVIIELNDNVLIIKTKETDQENGRSSRFTPEFDKRFKLSDKVKQDEISATAENGILYINLPKVDEAVKKPARSIEIA